MTIAASPRLNRSANKAADRSATSKQRIGTDDKPVVVVDNLFRSFGRGSKAVHVLRGLDLEVQAGEIIALYGPSGSGKTTLLNLIGALDEPNDGHVYILDKEISRMGEGRRARLRRRRIGFIFQNYALVSTYTAAENIDLALRLPGLWLPERRKRTREALKTVGLSAWSTHFPHQLSGGQRQRVAIARALALQPAIVLADEPTSGLDTRTSQRVLALFRNIAETQGTSFLIVSHDPLVIDYVDTAYDLVDGRLQKRVDAAHRTSEMPALPDAAYRRPGSAEGRSGESDNTESDDTENRRTAHLNVESHDKSRLSELADSHTEADGNLNIPDNELTDEPGYEETADS